MFLISDVVIVIRSLLIVVLKFKHEALT